MNDRFCGSGVIHTPHEYMASTPGGLATEFYCPGQTEYMFWDGHQVLSHPTTPLVTDTVHGLSDWIEITYDGYPADTAVDSHLEDGVWELAEKRTCWYIVDGLVNIHHEARFRKLPDPPMSDKAVDNLLTELRKEDDDND